MLQMLKKAAGTWAAKILLGLLVLSFAAWGITGASFNFATGTIANVGSQRISTIDFQREYFAEIQQLGRQIGRPLTPAQGRQFGLDREILTRLINQATLNDRVAAFGVGVSEDKVADQLFKDPNFLNAQGQFDPFRYQQILASAQLSESEFLDRQAKAVSRQQLVDGLVGDFYVSDVWRDALKDYASEERLVEYVTIDQRDIDGIGEPTNEELTTYFDQNKGQYRAPEYRALTLLTLDISDFDNAATITDEQARAEYERSSSRYVDPEKRNVKRISFQNDTEALKAQTRLQEGATFAELQKELGLDDSDVSLGFVEKGQLIDEKIADAAFALALNTPSEIIDGDFAIAIVFVDRIEGGSTEAFDDVKANIKKALAEDQNTRDMLAKVDEIEDARAEGSTFAEISNRLDVKLRTISPVSRTGERETTGTNATDIPAQNAVLDEAFSSDVGLENDVVENGRTGYVWFEVTEIKAARDRTLDEVRTQAVDDWKQSKISEAVSNKAEEVKKAVSPGTSLAEVAKNEGLLLKTAETVRRDRPTTGLTGAAIGIAFQGSEGFTAVAPGETPNQSLVIQVKEINKGTLEGGEVPGLSDLREGIENDVLTVYINLVREQEGDSFNAETFAYATDPEGSNRHNQSYGGY